MMSVESLYDSSESVSSSAIASSKACFAMWQALHHFIEALGLLRQLGEIDEVVPLLRHDQTSRSPSKIPRSADDCALLSLGAAERKPEYFDGAPITQDSSSAA